MILCEGIAIGFCQYNPYEKSGETWHGTVEIAGTYSIDDLIGETAYVGQGWGKAAVCELLQQIVQETDARRVIVQPDAKNRASCRTLLSVGFSYDSEKHRYRLDW